MPEPQGAGRTRGSTRPSEGKARLPSPRWLYPLGAIAVYALAGFLLVPWIAERTLVGTLDERLGLQTTLTSLSFNPFTFTLEAADLNVTQSDGAHLLGLDDLLVNFELSSLFRWAWTFDEVHLTRPRFDFERLSESETNVGRLIDAWSASAPPATETAAATSDAGPVRLIIADLRITEGTLTITDRVPAETFTTELAPIDITLADLSTIPDASCVQQVTISTESGATLSWSGTLAVNPLAVIGQVNVQGTYTPMLFRYFRDELALPISFDGGALDLVLDYTVELEDDGRTSAAVRDLNGTLAGLSISGSDGPALVELGALRVSGGRLLWPDKTVHVDEVAFERVSVNARRNAEGRYLPASSAPDSSPPASPAPAADPADPWQVTVGRLRLADWRIRHADEAFGDEALVITDLDLTLRDISNRDSQQMPFEVTATPSLGGTIQGDGVLELLPEASVAGTIRVHDLSLATLQPYLGTFANIGITSGTVSLAGDVEITSEVPFSYAGEVNVADLNLVDRTLEEALFSFQHLAIDHLEIDPAGLAISTVKLEAPYARIEIEEDGSNNIQRTLLGPGEDSGEGTGRPDDADAAPFSFSIGETAIADASARYTDLALPLPFEATVSNLTGRVTTLTSASAAPARVGLEGQVNEYGRLTIDGTLQPFAPATGTDIRIAFENVNLPSMSPYTIKFAGRRIDDGRTDLDLSIRLEAGQLTGDNHLVIRDLKLGDKVPYPDAMDLPLDLAVALLKDSNGTVDLSFPVSGAIDDPDFSYGGAVAKAFSNVILGLATSPFRLLGSLVGLNAADMESVAFPAGSAGLSPPQREVLDRLASALVQRPELVLEVTPAVDRAADRRALQVAAVDRAVAERLEADQTDRAMIDERRRSILESLHDEAGLRPSRSELRTLHTRAEEGGGRTLDALAYAEALRSALIDAADIPEPAIATLAEQRAQAVVEELAAQSELSADRVRIADFEERSADADGAVRMPLGVITGG